MGSNMERKKRREEAMNERARSRIVVGQRLAPSAGEILSQNGYGQLAADLSLRRFDHVVSQQEVGLRAQVRRATIPKTLNGHGLALNVFWMPSNRHWAWHQELAHGVQG